MLRRVLVPVPLVVWCLFSFSANSSEKLFCEIVEDPCLFLEELWWVLISLLLFFREFNGFRCFFLGAAGPRGAGGLAGFRFPCVLRGFKGRLK